ncbi:MAG TPA: response regulator [Steroidobacteraceae bacterium]|jgi:CheY-like chemotaxis protein|nr:response regulator [Steroidobacteraceae bacterium]
MTARRALVVDDSRSARAFLTRILERYELAVDGVESAEQAMEYLTHERPDVIFMDHLMPGMDGFQAVQAIKNNPLTATIPIMMYTSQEGELYLSQARALGAIGVLPKQTKHTDVSKVLEQLRLIGEPRPDDGIAMDYPEIFAEAQAETVKVHAQAHAQAQTPTFEETADFAAPSEPMAPPPVPPPAREAPAPERRGRSRPDLPAMPPELRAIVEAMVAHHIRNLQRFIAENLETQSDRMVGDVRLLLKDQPPPNLPVMPSIEPPRSSGGFWFGVLGLILACFAGWQWHEQGASVATLAAQLAQSQQDLESLQAQVGAASGAAGVSAAPAAGRADNGAAENSTIEPVPYGELPLAGARLERIQSLLSRLNAQGFKGVVEIRTIPGRFCMISGPSATPMLASELVPFTRCDQVGNPREDNGSVSARQSVAFANMIAAARQSANGKLDVEIGAGGADETITPYPPVSDGLTAGEWNRVAAANNRVEVHWQATR